MLEDVGTMGVDRRAVPRGVPAGERQWSLTAIDDLQLQRCALRSITPQGVGRHRVVGRAGHEDAGGIPHLRERTQLLGEETALPSRRLGQAHEAQVLPESVVPGTVLAGRRQRSTVSLGQALGERRAVDERLLRERSVQRGSPPGSSRP